MFTNTFATLDKIFGDFKRFFYLFSIVLNLFYIATPLSSIITGGGILYVNIVMCAAAAFYFVFHIVTYESKSGGKKAVKKIYKWFKILMSTVTLAITVYGLYIAMETASFVNVLLVALSAISWIIQVIVALIIMFVESRVELVKASILLDTAPVAQPINAVSNVIRRIKGDEIKERPTVSEALEKRIEKIRGAFLERRENEKQQLKAERLRRKQERKVGRAADNEPDEN